ncbi:hypothetical protein SAMN05216551_101358 [Chitinasiproducens palmae]|uniref:Uncharacterized protein n=1 Tax=Chitinasiproducens palmae TaxID=1770053 RepID=A0A1H2PJF6_9BURK|nr:hypothetical protein SAMN05216551_101358 [Chitinasiproducens palmae]
MTFVIGKDQAIALRDTGRLGRALPGVAQP